MRTREKDSSGEPIVGEDVGGKGFVLIGCFFLGGYLDAKCNT